MSEAAVEAEKIVNSEEQQRHEKIPCSLCGCTLNSETQAQAHFTGVRHLKQLEKHGLPIPEGVSRDKLLKYERKIQQHGKRFRSSNVDCWAQLICPTQTAVSQYCLSVYTHSNTYCYHIGIIICHGEGNVFMGPSPHTLGRCSLKTKREKLTYLSLIWHVAVASHVQNCLNYSNQIWHSKPSWKGNVSGGLGPQFGFSHPHCFRLMYHLVGLTLHMLLSELWEWTVCVFLLVSPWFVSLRYS